MTDELFSIKKRYDPHSQITYIRIQDIPKQYQDDLKLWLVGQTVPNFEVLGDEQDAVYSWDFERWHKIKFMAMPIFITD